MQTENEAYASLLCGHLRGSVYRLRRLPPEHLFLALGLDGDAPFPNPIYASLHEAQGHDVL